jgi:hypothetical protein
MTRIGQKTGTLNTSKNVQIIPITVLFETAYQNLNSGNRLINGRNSSFDFVGSSGPPSSAKLENIIKSWLAGNLSKCHLPSRSNAGSIFGVKNAMNKFK